MPDEQIQAIIRPLMKVYYEAGVDIRKKVYPKVYASQHSANARFYVHMGNFQERKGEKSNRPAPKKARQIVRELLKHTLDLIKEVDSVFDESMSTYTGEDDLFDW